MKSGTLEILERSCCAHGHCHDETDLHPLITVKVNFKSTAYKDILDYSVLLTLWQHFGENPHMGVIARCPQTFGHVYIPYTTYNLLSKNTVTVPTSVFGVTVE